MHFDDLNHLSIIDTFNHYHLPLSEDHIIENFKAKPNHFEGILALPLDVRHISFADDIAEGSTQGEWEVDFRLIELKFIG